MKPIIKKKINTESKNYKLLRGAIDVTAYAGGCLAVDCVVIPYLEAIFGKRLRLLKYVGYFGTLGLSAAAGFLSLNVIDEFADALVDVHNVKVDELEQEVYDVRTNDIPLDYMVYTIDPKERIDNAIDEYHIFEFTTEDAAKEVGSKIVQVCFGGTKGSLSIAEYLSLRGMDPKAMRIPYSNDFGWENAEELRPEIEKITDNCWILDLPKYDYINVVISNPKED